ncbi:ferredoxin [Streptosporangium subroseum]|uniref:ferredoxin n=1 Tax=Streptosporangium subroseum TaxID=106412 RepID=UPI0030856A1D|nr:ferredoxin [Streptosporangium subroseum]
MRIVVDLNRCEGYAQCAFLAPDVFTMHGEEALMYTPHADDAQREHVVRAAAACPVQAILIDQGADQQTDRADEPALVREADVHVG